MQGGAVGFYAGDIRALMDDMKALKPTVTPAVPRLLNRIHDKVGNLIKLLYASLLSVRLSSNGYPIRTKSFGLIILNFFFKY